LHGSFLITQLDPSAGPVPSFTGYTRSEVVLPRTVLSPCLKEEAYCNQQSKSGNGLRGDRHLRIGGLAIAFCTADQI
jgi:hypothetical protein